MNQENYEVYLEGNLYDVCKFLAEHVVVDDFMFGIENEAHMSFRPIKVSDHKVCSWDADIAKRRNGYYHCVVRWFECEDNDGFDPETGPIIREIKELVCNITELKEKGDNSYVKV